MQRKMQVSCALAAVCFLLISGSVAEAADIDDGLRQLMAQKDGSGMYPVLMIFHDLPEWQDGTVEVSEDADKIKSRKAILAAQKKKTRKLQESSAEILGDPNLSDGVGDVHQLYLANAIAFEGDAEVIEALGNLSVNATLFYDQSYDLTGATRRGATRGTAVAVTGEKAAAATDTVWSVKYINADRVWNELGYTGAGVLVAHIDSGVWLTHPDLVSRLWVNPGEMAGNGLGYHRFCVPDLPLDAA